MTHPLLKKSTLDPADWNSYRPISNLSFVSKTVERIIDSKLTSHAHEHSYFRHISPPIGRSTPPKLLSSVSTMIWLEQWTRDMLVPSCCSIYQQNSTLSIMSSWWKFWKNDSDWKGKLMTGSAHTSVTGSRLYVLELRDLLNSFWPAASRKDQFSGQNLSWPTPKMWPKFSNYTKCNIICTPMTCSRMLIRSHQSSLPSSRNSRTVPLLSVTGVDRGDCNWMQRKQNACTSVLPSTSRKFQITWSASPSEMRPLSQWVWSEILEYCLMNTSTWRRIFRTFRVPASFICDDFDPFVISLVGKSLNS